MHSDVMDELWVIYLFSFQNLFIPAAIAVEGIAKRQGVGAYGWRTIGDTCGFCCLTVKLLKILCDITENVHLVPLLHSTHDGKYIILFLFSLPVIFHTVPIRNKYEYADSKNKTIKFNIKHLVSISLTLIS